MHMKKALCVCLSLAIAGSVFAGCSREQTPEEIEAVKGEMKLISLGSRILRTETAGFTTLAILMYHIETSCLEKSN